MRYSMTRIGIIMMTAALTFGIATPDRCARATDLLSSDKPLSIKVRDVDVRDVLRIIAEEYGLNIVIGRGVEGRISYEIENATLRAGFEAILKSNGLGYIVEDNIIRVDDLKALRAELQEELEIRQAQQKLREARKLENPLQTKEIQLDYIGDTLSSRKEKARELKETLEPLLSHKKERGVDRGANIQLLRETNTLLVTDVAENLREIEAVARRLDQPPAQIRIEARVVEMFHGDSLGLGIQWGGQYRHDSSEKKTDGTPERRGAVGGRRGDATGSMLGTPQNLGVNLPLLGEFAPVGTIGYTLLDNLSLDIELQAMESKGKLKLVSKPSLQVVENENAEILVGSQVPVASGLDPETGQVEVRQEEIGTKLNITPQITQDENIVLEVEVERSTIGDDVIIQGQPYFTIDKRNAKSQVRVRDGETIVIGGLVTTDERRTTESVPFVSKIPIVGLLFRSRTESKTFDETMIFLTPHIVSREQS
jgi:type IV pilus assembly protein PilQ